MCQFYIARCIWKIWYFLGGTVVTDSFWGSLQAVLEHEALNVGWERKKALSVFWGKERVPRNSSPGIILQLLHYYKEELTQQSPGDAEYLQSTNHWGRQAKCKNIFTNSTCTEQSCAIFRAAAKIRGTFVETPKGHQAGGRWRGFGIFSLADSTLPYQLSHWKLGQSNVLLCFVLFCFVSFHGLGWDRDMVVRNKVR